MFTPKWCDGTIFRCDQTLVWCDVFTCFFLMWWTDAMSQPSCTPCPAGTSSPARSEKEIDCTGVRHAWTLGLVLRPVALSGMIQWQSEAFD